MSATRRGRLLARVAVALTVALASLMLASPTASAQSYFGPPKVVVMGDSFAAGVGTPPYTVTNGCKRSNAAYGKLLESYRLVRVEAFVACSGATTTQVGFTGSNGEPPQVNSITPDTDVVTVQALGNDFAISLIEAMCFSTVPGVNCEAGSYFPVPLGHPLYGVTVGQVVASIPSQGAAALDALYPVIRSKLVKPGAKAIAIGYPNLLGNGGIYCAAVTPAELAVASQIVSNLNAIIQDRAKFWGFKFIAVDRLFRGWDACGLFNAIYPPLPPGSSPAASTDPEGQGVLHPNRLGHAIYAGALLGRLYS
jgi:GDSL-like Lipase/Acylhydrolase family